MKTNWPAIRIGCLIFASAALATSPSDAQTQEPAASATASVISSVAITQAAQRSSVRVAGAGPLEVHAARVQNPDRLVLDFSSAKLAVQKTVIPGVSAPVRGVRMGQFRPDVARVVIDLTAASPYQIARDGVSVVVSFATVVQDPAAAAPALKATSEKIPVERPAFRYDVAGPHSSAVSSAKLRRISAPRFALPGELTQPSVVLASFGGSTEPARPTPQQAAQQQSGNAAATVAATGRYTGEPISVNLKDVDLKDFFRLIHEISGLNVVLDPAV
ncbi:MAG: type and secretion system protein, partial [Bryobacterales bacterium]|nr:type and secretion system protein [Bryobacterales bacterium]